MTFTPPTLQPEHGYVLLVPVLMAIVHIWAGFKVGAARAKYGVHYPQMYAETSDPNFHAFNCVQRAHQNVIENVAIFLALLFASSVYRPVWAALAGLVRVLGFVTYIHFYSTGVPEKRQYGTFGYLGLVTSIGLIIEAAVRLLVA